MREPTEMELRVAKAICATENPYCDVDAVYGFNCAGEFVLGGEGGETKPRAWMWYIETARAAIRAMREPTQEMLEGGNCAEWYGGIQGHKKDEHEEVKRVWQGAIDAASPPTE